MSALIALVAAFVAGAIAVVAVEFAAVYFIVRRIISKSKAVDSDADSSCNRQISAANELISSDKQGMIWVLEPQKVPKIPSCGELNRKRELVEAFPVPRPATIKGKYLILTEVDGSRTTILLKGCKVVAVSATGLSSKKWNKRYPIKVESNNAIYGGSEILFIYLETSWEKEDWCKALRVAACDKKETAEWFLTTSEDFVCYLRSLTEGYPSFVKPSCYQLGPLDRTSKIDSPPSKVRLLWKRLAKRASKSAPERKMTNTFMEDNSASSKAKSVDSGSHVPEVHDTEVDEKVNIDEGTLCWNLLMSRLFFDAKSNLVIKDSLKDRIQRTLSSMRTPSYIGAMTCTDIDTGNLPPHIQSMRVVPTNMKETWALEMDVEYSGDLVLYIEVRLDVHDKDFQNGTIDPSVELSSAHGVATDFLQGFEHFREELHCADETNDLAVQNNEENNSLERVTSSKSSGTSSTAGSRWKSIVNSVAKHVAQVPFMLAIRVGSLKGSMQIRIKPPPSDQLWFGFTSMPDIDFHLESFVGEHKITSSHISLYLVNRFKAAIRDTLVFPNCESLCIPWMLAEKDDWVPRTVAPFTWIKRDVQGDSTPPNEMSNNIEQPDETSSRNEASKEKAKNPQDSIINNYQSRDDDSLESSVSNSLETVASPSLIDTNFQGSSPLNEIRTPLLQKAGSPEHIRNLPHYVSLKDRQNREGEEEDGKPKRMGRKARMLDLGRKIGEKIEEKSKQIIDYSKQSISDDSLDNSLSNCLEIVANPSPVDTCSEGSKSVNELSTPLLQRAESPEHLRNSAHSLSLKDVQNRDAEEEESRLKRLGRKSRMMDLGRKMSERFEEKSRNIVDKMRRQ